MKAVEFTHEIRNRLSYAFSPPVASKWQLRVLSIIHYAVNFSEDSEQLRDQLLEAASQCQQAIAIMDRELGIGTKSKLETDKRKAR